MIKECDKFLLSGGESDKQILFLDSISRGLSENLQQLSSKDIQHNLYKLALSRMVEKKYAFYSLYPELSVQKQSKESAQCVKKHMKHFLQPKQSSQQFLNKKRAYLAELVVKSIRAKQQWNSLPGKQEELSIAQESARKVWQKRNNRHRFLRLSKIEKEEMITEHEHLKKIVTKKKQAVDILKKEILLDPLWSESTGTFEWSKQGQFDDFKPSQYLRDIMGSFSKVKGNKHQGDKFLGYLQGLVVSGDETRAKIRVEQLLSADSHFFDTINLATKTNLQIQLLDVDKGIEQLCESKGQGLVHYQHLVDDLASLYTQTALANKSDAEDVLLKFRRQHCTLLQKPVKNDLSKTLAFGGILLAGAALAPFTGGGSVAVGLMLVGGTGLTALDGIAAYNSYKKYNLEKGLVRADMLDAQQMRTTLHDVRVKTGMTALDVTLLPLDIFALGKVAVKSKKLASSTEKSSKSKQVILTIPNKSKPIDRNMVKSSPQALAFKNKYAQRNLLLDNTAFIDSLKETVPPGKVPLYFDVENSVLKKINDVVFEEKGFGDAAGNLFSNKVYALVKNDPILKSKLAAEYKDYKSLRFKFLLNEGDDSVQVTKRLEKIYRQANDEFVRELKTSKLAPLWGGLEGQLGNPAQWFLAGTGKTALQANMANRGAREALGSYPTGLMANFSARKQGIQKHLDNIVEIRDELSSSRKFRDSGIMIKGSSGDYILDDAAVEIIRKSTTSNGDAFRIDEVGQQVKKLYGTDLSKTERIKMINYFEETDAMSPPLFIHNREVIPMARAQHGIVSVDFTGIGVHNTQKAMEGINLAVRDSSKHTDWVDRGLSSINNKVQDVTDQMEKSKKYYKNLIKKQYKDSDDIYFSGDDGIYMPKRELTHKEKMSVVGKISKHNPTEFRMTFVKTSYADGTIVPPDLRSKLVVQAEKLEKSIRKDIVGTGVDEISRHKSKNLMIAVDYVPSTTGEGTFNLFVSGKVSAEDLKKVDASFHRQVLDRQKMGEIYSVHE